MKFEKTIYDYLTGKTFSNGLKVNIYNRDHEKFNRLDLLQSLTKNKSIIHVGCVDHLPLIKQKISRNVWLHKRLDDASKRCIGIDLNKEGIDFIKFNLNYKNVFHMNIIKDDIPVEIGDSKWDYMILGELLEHIDNPVAFLVKIHEKYSKIVDHMIVTVPSAFSFNSIRYMFKNVELINSDHRYWFTPYTLAKISVMAGYSLGEFHLCKSFPNKKLISFRRYINNKFPLTNDSILMVLKF